MARMSDKKSPTPNFNKILWVKFGWSDYYRGGPVDGNFGWLNDQRGGAEEGRGHEAYNFLPVHETYYCYVPPQAKDYAPSNADNTGWTVVCLAKHPKHKGIHIVGWYENATLIGKWEKVPVGHPDRNFSYCIKSETVFFIPPEERNSPFSHASVKQGKFSFLAGPGVVQTENKKRVLAILEAKLTSQRGSAVPSPSEASVPDPELDSTDPLAGFGTPEHRKKVEKAAENVVISYFRDKKFRHVDRTKIPCGYDFLFHKGSKEFHVEVKGTSGEFPRFFLTKNEYEIGYQSNPVWRLAMVTYALSDDPKLQILDAKQLKKAFDLNPYVFIGKPISMPQEI